MDLDAQLLVLFLVCLHTVDTLESYSKKFRVDIFITYTRRRTFQTAEQRRQQHVYMLISTRLKLSFVLTEFPSSSLCVLE